MPIYIFQLGGEKVFWFSYSLKSYKTMLFCLKVLYKVKFKIDLLVLKTHYLTLPCSVLSLDSSKKSCRYYMRYGCCPFKTECLYLHDKHARCMSLPVKEIPVLSPLDNNVFYTVPLHFIFLPNSIIQKMKTTVLM